jgi:hypothetical protein
MGGFPGTQNVVLFEPRRHTCGDPDAAGLDPDIRPHRFCYSSLNIHLKEV